MKFTWSGTDGLCTERIEEFHSVDLCAVNLTLRTIIYFNSHAGKLPKFWKNKAINQ